jgi:hypothetical protein
MAAEMVAYSPSSPSVGFPRTLILAGMDTLQKRRFYRLLHDNLRFSGCGRTPNGFYHLEFLNHIHFSADTNAIIIKIGQSMKQGLGFDSKKPTIYRFA